MKVSYLLYKLADMPESVHAVSSTDDEIEHSLRQGKFFLVKERQGLVQLYGVEILKKLHLYMSVLWENQAIVPLKGMCPRPLRYYYLNKFYSDYEVSFKVGFEYSKYSYY